MTGRREIIGGCTLYLGDCLSLLDDVAPAAAVQPSLLDIAA